VMLNRYPYNNGHLMIAPRRHLASPELLSREERAALAELQAAAVVRLRRALRCGALNLGANLGHAAGAGFADHMHWHAVPRWEGDTNFMPVIAGTRVLSQHLDESFNLLEPLFRSVGTAIS
jgi:ATP adenylyltransferase